MKNLIENPNIWFKEAFKKVSKNKYIFDQKSLTCGEVEVSMLTGLPQCVGWVDPAVGVQHLLGDLLRVDAHDGGANVLA